MSELAKQIEQASSQHVSQETAFGVITPLMWTSPETRDHAVQETFEDLRNSLQDGQLTEDSWHHFYRFLIASHQTKRLGSRLSVCELADQLRLAGVQYPGFFAGCYGACMGLLEQYDDQR